MQYTLYLKSNLKKFKNEKIPLLQFDSKDPTNICYYWLSKDQIKDYKHEGFWNVEWNRILALREDIAEDIKNWDKQSLYSSFEEWFEKQTILRNDFEWEKGV